MRCVQVKLSGGEWQEMEAVLLVLVIYPKLDAMLANATTAQA